MARTVKDKFAETIEKYRTCPEFLFVDLSDVNQRGMTGDTPLHAAVVRGELTDVEVFIACGADINSIGDLGNTPLHHASSRGMEQIVDKLLQCGANVDMKNEFGQTALDLAKLRGRAAVARTLKARQKPKR